MSTTAPAPVLTGFPVLEQAGYRLRLAEGEADLRKVQRLRFEVFNQELHEGFEDSWKTGLDQEAYDPFAHHLVVEDLRDDRAVGTYRLQTPEMAAAGAGLYTASEYDLAPLAALLPGAVEASRACVHKDHREGAPIQLLWKGLARYLAANDARYLFGLCSLTSQSIEEGVRGWKCLHDRGSLHATLRVHPLPAFECLPAAQIESTALPPLPKMPPLFDAYLRIATKVVGYPAIDRAFKTIDYLALLDLKQVPAIVLRRFSS